MGTGLETLTTNDGTTYRDVTIAGITEGAVSFTHSDGANTIAFENLPQEIQDHYAYSPTRFVDSMISELRPAYMKTPEEIAAENRQPVAPRPDPKPYFPKEVVVQQLKKIDDYIEDLEARLERAEAALGNVHRIDAGSKIKTSQADKRKMTVRIDAAIMEYRARLRGAERQREILLSHMPPKK